MQTFIPDSASPGARSMLSRTVGSGAQHLMTPFKSNTQRLQGALSAGRRFGTKKPTNAPVEEDTAPRVGVPSPEDDLRNDILKNDPGIRRLMTKKIREEFRQERPEVIRAQKFNKAKKRFHSLTRDSGLSPDAAKKQILQEFGEIPRASS